MNQLTNHELHRLEESLRMEANMVRFTQTCANILTDSQLKNMCQQIAQDHNNYLQSLSRFYNMRTSV